MVHLATYMVAGSFGVHAYWIVDRLILMFEDKRVTMSNFDKCMSVLDEYMPDMSHRNEPFLTNVLEMAIWLCNPECNIWQTKAGSAVSSKELYLHWEEMGEITSDRRAAQVLTMNFPIH